MKKAKYVQQPNQTQIIHPSDTTLITLFQSGHSERALRLFFKKYQTNMASLTRFVIRMGASSPDAQDICQDAMIRFLKNLESGKFQVRKDGCLLSYLFAIVRHFWLTELRQRRRLAKRVTPVDDFSESYEANLTSDTGHDRHIVALKTCFDNLDARGRRLLWGHYIEGCSYQLLAKELQLANWRVACQQTYRKRCQLRQAFLKRISA